MSEPGWLEKFTNWIKEQIEKVWTAFSDFMGDMIVKVIDAIFDVIATAVEALPVPDFIADHSIGSLLGQAGPVIGWLAETFQLDAGLGLIGAAYAFRLLRKFLTLFQW